jgi:hypothetical protein
MFFYPFHVGILTMPPPKCKTDEDGDLPSEETEKNDLFSFPDVMNMDKPTLKSELNQLQVCIVGVPLKANLQEKLHAAYADEIMDKVAKYYQNYQHCFMLSWRKTKRSLLLPSNAFSTRSLLLVLLKLPGLITKRARR